MVRDMALIGQRNTLTIVRASVPGLYLDGGAHGDILLPGRYIPAGALPGHKIDVFVYRDSEDRIVATTETPYAEVGQFAFLRAVGSNPRIGVFLDWGLEKDLLLPPRELADPIKQGDWVVVYVYRDESTDRVVASARLKRWLDRTPAEYTVGQKVKLLIVRQTPLGFLAVVNHAHTGLLYRGELAAPLTVGQSLDGFVRSVRPDGKLDLGLDPAGFRRIAPLADQIVELLKEHDGFLPLHDGSSPEDIRATVGTSKKAFKQAIGGLFREKRIVIGPTGIRLVSETPQTGFRPSRK